MKISIAEGLYLIMLDDQEGRLLAAAEKSFNYGLLSAAIFDLKLLKKIDIKGGKIEVLDQTGTANGVLDKVLQNLEPGAPFIEQLGKLNDTFKDLRADMDALLVQRGILKREETKLLWIPLSERMGNANYVFEQEIRNGLRTIVLQETNKARHFFMILLSLIYDCQILDEVFTERDDFIDAEKAAKDIVNRPEMNAEIGSVLSDLREFFREI